MILTDVSVVALTMTHAIDMTTRGIVTVRWTPVRELVVVVDVSEDALRQRGYVVSPVVRKFLAAFGDLYYYDEPERRTMTVCHTRAAVAARKGWPDIEPNVPSGVKNVEFAIFAPLAELRVVGLHHNFCDRDKTDYPRVCDGSGIAALASNTKF